jgi:hypothetical protein
MKREAAIRFCAALWGLATAIALLPAVTAEAPPNQLPGYAKSIHLDAHSPMRFVVAMIVLPIVFSAASTSLARLMSGSRTWAFNGTCAAMIASLWLSLAKADVRWTTLPVALAVVVFVALRNVEQNFTRDDVILVPTFLTLLMAVMDLVPYRGLDVYVVCAIALTLALRLIVRDPIAFTCAPLALIAQTSFLSSHQRHSGWIPLAVVAITTLSLRQSVRNRRVKVAGRTIIAILIYPLAIYSYTNATSLATAEGKPRVNLFEEAHGLLPASQMLRGELPYRDVLPGHGLIEDGLLDWLALRASDGSIGRALKARATVGALNGVAIYALATAATGSPQAGFLAFLFGIFTGSAPPNVRSLPALFALALIVAAVRRRKPRLLFAAALLCVVAGVTSLDFAAYTFATLLIAVFRFRPRLAALRAVAAGIALGTAVLVAGLAAFGILGAFITTTFFEIPKLGPAYVLNVYEAPDAFASLHRFPEVLGGIFDHGAYLYAIWIGALLLVAMTIARRARRRIEPLVVIAIWITLCAGSYGERHHLHFQFAVGPLLVAATLYLFRTRRRALALAACAALVVLLQPTYHLLVVSMLRHARGPLAQNLVEVGLPRAHGALFATTDVAVIDSVKRWSDASLAPNETFFDFTNRGLLYFLLDRDSPIREIEVPQIERVEVQRDVIARLQANPRVRAAIVAAVPGGSAIDGIPNEERAPLVWQYLQTHFEPAFTEGEIAIWRRK